MALILQGQRALSTGNFNYFLRQHIDEPGAGANSIKVFALQGLLLIWLLLFYVSAGNAGRRPSTGDKHRRSLRFRLAQNLQLHVSCQYQFENIC
ncbi:hypothetical protein [Pseudomonas phage pPA-3099-2aT.2]|uniref:Uncharacterized protein n=1 Tax=Pseudomonas phage pPA-3099-2aT.2 TaxID=3003808 RepID=A0AAF0AT31_9CAUD|nr:hypothetical protein QE325_gp106 [Pseudomonas phage pPA-3099-2aT.2]WBQ35275.1 hypothetical protein [Pseudomonas phage pPA-3099-2aT.2]